MIRIWRWRCTAGYPFLAASCQILQIGCEEAILFSIATSRYAESHADHDGVDRTPVVGLTILRETSPTLLHYAVSRPLVALLQQGRKRLVMGRSAFDLGAGESLLITVDVSTGSQITQSSAGRPYILMLIDLDPRVIKALVVEMGLVPFAAETPVRIDATEREVAEAAPHLLRLLDHPASRPVLEAKLIRELAFLAAVGPPRRRDP